ncbi:hypothetical protein [Marinoscillum sp.]|uniref:hypothetical protein n=1 Tax=Marinoscillum sp. TaxID=2024838 RepID=UPI003BA88153
MRPYRLHYLLIVAILASFGCEEETPTPSQRDQEYDIYSLYLNTLEAEVLVVAEESYHGFARFGITERSLNNFVDNYPGIESTLVMHLSTADQDSILYENKFNVPHAEIILINRPDFAEIFSEGYQEGWNNFVSTYGESSLSVSFTRISFNETMDKAIFSAAVGQWSYLGYMVYLEYENDQWAIKQVINTFVT